ncbi:MAG: helix-turn-helix domain-containing protein [Candidatus Bathyarchaeota archaeon]|nr:helix-turn-helix domain-containing protein [Candidatus Bathyarchaeota archaeon]
MSEEIKEEMKKLREEVARLKEQLEDVTDREGRKSRGIFIDIGNAHEYVEDVMESVAEGIHGELHKCILIGPGGVRIAKKERLPLGEGEAEVSFPKAAEVMSALGHEYRLRILKELVSGGKYVNELQEKLSEITSSTLSSHLKVLEEAGLVVQEKVRGRYLITIPGRTAYKMTTRITRFLERGSHE